mgnify:CR=1 FL=1
MPSHPLTAARPGCLQGCAGGKALRFATQSTTFGGASPDGAQSSVPAECVYIHTPRRCLHEPLGAMRRGFRVTPLRKSREHRTLGARSGDRGVTTTAAPGGSRPLVIPKSLPNFRFPLSEGESWTRTGWLPCLLRGFGGSDFRPTKRFKGVPERKKRSVVQWRSAKQRQRRASPARTTPKRMTRIAKRISAMCITRGAYIDNRSPEIAAGATK